MRHHLAAVTAEMAHQGWTPSVARGIFPLMPHPAAPVPTPTVLKLPFYKRADR